MGPKESTCILRRSIIECHMRVTYWICIIVVVVRQSFHAQGRFPNVTEVSEGGPLAGFGERVAFLA